MLRRKPTALTITSEDIASFEETYLRNQAYAKFLKTGEDPDGLFRDGSGAAGGKAAGTRGEDAQMTGGTSAAVADGGAGGAVDPNDELKPLPGDKARIVRSREERILGAGPSR